MYIWVYEYAHTGPLGFFNDIWRFFDLFVCVGTAVGYIFNSSAITAFVKVFRLKRMCVYTYLRTHFHTYTYIHACIYIHIYIYTYKLHFKNSAITTFVKVLWLARVVCVRVYIYTYTHTLIYVFTYTYVYINLHF